ncbi:MAG: protein-glutamate methylesterase/protein-glutamine glutaminase [Bacillota bacterium]
MMHKKIKVLIVDDSPAICKILSKELAKDSAIKVVGTAVNPFLARDQILHCAPDVMILDIEMPRMDGLTFLEKLMKHFPLPVIIVSSLAKEGCDIGLKALEHGAVAIMSKPNAAYSTKEMIEQLIENIKAASLMKHSKIMSQIREKALYDARKNALKKTHPDAARKIIAIGASTGGTEAIKNVLTKLPAEIPSIVIVQHMPPNFTEAFANRLNSLCPFEVKEAMHGELLTSSKALVAPGNKHMSVSRKGNEYYVEISDGPLVFHQRPSVEVLFNSVAECAGADAIGILLTGMGKDGAHGLLNMKIAGALTIAQDEDSCIVYGMPKEAAAIGAATKILTLDEIPGAVLSHFN